MIDRFIGLVELLIETHGTLGVFLAAVIEEIVAPIPSGLVMMSAGYAFLSGEPINGSNIIFLLTHAALPLSIGLTLGSLIVYFLAYTFGEALIKKFGKYFFISWNDVEKVSANFKKGYRDEITLLGLRILPIIPSVALNTVAGILKIQPLHYIVATIIGTFIRASLISFAGWQLGNVYKEYAFLIDKYENYAFAIVIAIFVGFILRKQFKKKTISF